LNEESLNKNDVAKEPQITHIAPKIKGWAISLPLEQRDDELLKAVGKSPLYLLDINEQTGGFNFTPDLNQAFKVTDNGMMSFALVSTFAKANDFKLVEVEGTAILSKEIGDKK
jgi:hypothetical protein